MFSTYRLVFILISISADFFLLTTAKSTTQVICSDNEQYYNNSLSPLCDTNCQDIERYCGITTQYAVAGCYCRLGYARNLQQQCIPVNECSTDCPPGERPVNRFQRNCDQSCGESSNTQICYGYNERNCICAIGYCRNSNGECVEMHVR